MSFIKNMKIGKKITFAVMFIMLVSFITIGLLSYSSSSQSLHDTLETSLVSMISYGAEIVSSEVKSLLKDVESITYYTEIKSMDWTVQKDILIEEAKRLGCIRMGVTDLTGKGNFTDGSTHDLSNLNYMNQALQGITNITDPSPSKIDNTMVIVIASPIKDVSGKIVGVLVATHENMVFSKIVEKIRIGNDGYSFVINKQGTTIAHAKNELVVSQDNIFENLKKDPQLQSLADLERKMVNGEKGFGEYSYSGINKFMAFAPIQNSEWSIGLTVSRDEFYTGLNNLKTEVAAIIVFFILLGIAASMIISSLLVTKPVRKLVHISDRLAMGDTDITIESDSKDEIGILMTSFSNIIKNTKEQSDNARKIASGNLDIVMKRIFLQQV